MRPLEGTGRSSAVGIAERAAEERGNEPVAPSALAAFLSDGAHVRRRPSRDFQHPYFFAGGGVTFTNLRVMRSLSPIAAYLSRSLSPRRYVGGNVHTPSGWSLVSFGLALISDFAESLNPAASTRSMTQGSGSMG